MRPPKAGPDVEGIYICVHIWLLTFKLTVHMAPFCILLASVLVQRSS